MSMTPVAGSRNSGLQLLQLWASPDALSHTPATQAMSLGSPNIATPRANRSASPVTPPARRPLHAPDYDQGNAGEPEPALRRALRSGSLQQLREVLEGDASSANDRFWEHNIDTPLCYAVRTNCGFDMISLLLAHGASVHETDIRGRTPLMVLSAMPLPPVREYPRPSFAYDAEWDPTNSARLINLPPPDLIANFLPPPFPMQSGEGDEETSSDDDNDDPVFMSSETKRDEEAPALRIAKRLLHAGANLQTLDLCGMLPVQLAQESGRDQLVGLFRNFEVVRFLKLAAAMPRRAAAAECKEDNFSFAALPNDLICRLSSYIVA